MTTNLAVIQPLAAAAVLALFATTVHTRLPPRAAAHFVTWVTAIVAVVALPTLALLGLNALAHLPLVGASFMWCAETVGVHTPGSPWLGLLALLLLSLGAHRALRVLREHRRLRCRDAGTVDVVDDATAYAFTLPGKGGRVVVSSGLLGMLSATETEIVLSHEGVHARHRHDRFLLATELATAAFLPLGLLGRRVRFSLERWADDVTARQYGDRRLVATTIGKVALHTSQPRVVAGFAGTGVGARVQALLAPPVATLRAPALVAGAFAISSLSALAAIQLHHLGPLFASLCRT